MVLEIEPRALGMLHKFSTTELHPQPYWEVLRSMISCIFEKNILATYFVERRLERPDWNRGDQETTAVSSKRRQGFGLN
jgi:hypothetical protein